MKYFVLFILIVPIVVAQEINFFKTEYSPGETAQGEIITNLNTVEDIASAQIEILDSFGNDQPVLVNIIKINDNYYLFYFDTLKTQLGTYNLEIGDILYLENNILKTASFERQFSLTQKNYNLISLQPGAVYFSPDDAFQAIRVSNLENYAISLELESNELIIPSINLLQIPGLSSKMPNL